MQVLDLQITKVDQLGMLLAQIADLEAQAEALKTELKQEEGHIEGNLYKACVAPLEKLDIIWASARGSSTMAEDGR